jgi:hypothetical protein
MTLLWIGTTAMFAVVRLPFGMGSTGTDYGKDVRFDQGGNIYVTGYFQGTVDFDPSPEVHAMTAAGAVTNPGAVDAFVAKYDDDGNYLWAFSISSAGADMPHSLEITQDGFLLTGYLGGSADFDPDPSQQYILDAGTGRDMFIAKYSPAADFVFAMRAGDIETLPIQTDDDRVEDGMDVCADANGNIYATGVYKGVIDLDPSGGSAEYTSVGDSRDLYLLSLDPAGNYRWGFSIGGTGQDHGHGVRVVETSQILLPEPVITQAGNQHLLRWEPLPGAAEYRIYRSDDPYGENWTYLQTASGVEVQLDTDRLSRFYRVTAIFPTSVENGLVVITGFFSGTVDFDPSDNAGTLSSAGGWDIFLAAYSAADGTFQWAKRIGGSGNDQSRPGGICIDNQNRILITGDFAGSVDFDPDNGMDIHVSNGAGDIFVGIYNAGGQYLNAFSMGSASSDFAHRITTDSEANILITGQYTSSLDFDPSPGVFVLSPNGGANGDVFLAKYGQDGEFLWANSFGGAVSGTGSYQIGTGVSVDWFDRPVITGRFYLSPDVDPTDGEFVITSNGSCDCFVVKYDAGGNLIAEPPSAIEEDASPAPMLFDIYPNPFRDSVGFRLGTGSGCQTETTIEVYDIRGRLLASFPYAENKTLDWDRMATAGQPVPNGIYLVVARTDNLPPSTRKVVRMK